MTAARTGLADAVRVLIERGADPDRREGRRGQTALMWAAVKNHLAAAGALARRRPPAAKRGRQGVFYSNTGKCWPEAETLLLALGADPSSATGADNTISDWSVDDAPPDAR